MKNYRRIKSEPVLGVDERNISDLRDCASGNASHCQSVCNGDNIDKSNGFHPCEEEGAASTSDDQCQYLALDCEFVGVGPRKLSALGRCSIVDYCGRVVCDIYAQPDEPVTDYRTRWSGIRKHDMIRAIPVDNARNIIKNILRGKVVVGHALQNDLSVLRMEEFVPPEMRRDTSHCLRLRELAGLADRRAVSLKALTFAILGRWIQTREHDSVEDARASMELFKRVQAEWKTDVEQPKNQKVLKLDNLPLKRHRTEPGVVQQSADERCMKRPRLDSESMLFLSDNYWPDDIHLQVRWF